MNPLNWSLQTWLIVGAVVLAGAMGVALAAQTVKLHEERAAHEVTKRLHGDLVIAAQREQLARAEANRETERLMARNNARITDERNKQFLTLERRAAEHRRVAEQLRSDIAAFAAGAGEGGAAASASCEARAGALGDVLGACLQRRDQLAAAAEAHNTDAAALWAERQQLTCDPTDTGARTQ